MLNVFLMYTIKPVSSVCTRQAGQAGSINDHLASQLTTLASCWSSHLVHVEENCLLPPPNPTIQQVFLLNNWPSCNFEDPGVAHLCQGIFVVSPQWLGHWPASTAEIIYSSYYSAPDCIITFMTSGDEWSLFMRYSALTKEIPDEGLSSHDKYMWIRLKYLPQQLSFSLSPTMTVFLLICSYTVMQLFMHVHALSHLAIKITWVEILKDKAGVIVGLIWSATLNRQTKKNSAH